MTTTCSKCGEPWPRTDSAIPHTCNQPTVPSSERRPRERFVGSLIGPAGGTVVKSGIKRLDFDLMYGSAMALRVAAVLQEGEPCIRVRVLAKEGGQLIERVLYDGPLARASEMVVLSHESRHCSMS